LTIQVRKLTGDFAPSGSPRSGAFLSRADHFAAQCAAIDARQVLFNCGSEQRDVRDLAQIFRDEPDRFICGHPVEMIEPRESFIQRKRVLPKRSVTLANQFSLEVIRAGSFAAKSPALEHTRPPKVT
jgi:hypothetical protein